MRALISVFACTYESVYLVLTSVFACTYWNEYVVFILLLLLLKSPKGAILLQSPGREPWVRCVRTYFEPLQGRHFQDVRQMPALLVPLLRSSFYFCPCVPRVSYRALPSFHPGLFRSVVPTALIIRLNFDAVALTTLIYWSLVILIFDFYQFRHIYLVVVMDDWMYFLLIVSCLCVFFWVFDAVVISRCVEITRKIISLFLARRAKLWRQTYDKGSIMLYSTEDRIVSKFKRTEDKV